MVAHDCSSPPPPYDVVFSIRAAHLESTSNRVGRSLLYGHSPPTSASTAAGPGSSSAAFFFFFSLAKAAAAESATCCATSRLASAWMASAIAGATACPFSASAEKYMRSWCSGDSSIGTMTTVLVSSSSRTIVHAASMASATARTPPPLTSFSRRTAWQSTNRPDANGGDVPRSAASASSPFARAALSNLTLLASILFSRAGR